MADMVNKDRQDAKAQQVQLVLMVSVEKTVTQAPLAVMALMEHLGLRVHKEPLVNPVHPAKMVNQVSLVNKVKWATEEHLD